MNEEKEKMMAITRYGIVANLLHLDSHELLKDAIEMQARHPWPLPDGRQRKFAPGTIEEWFYDYRHGGLAALTKGSRKDEGLFRKMPAEVGDLITDILRQTPTIHGSTIWQALQENEEVKDKLPSSSTFYRYVKRTRPVVASTSETRERRAFEGEHAGQLWQGDLMYGPYVTIKDSSNRRLKAATFLVQIIDDNSRMALGGQFFLTQSLNSHLEVLRDSLLANGICQRYYCDNGKIYTSLLVKQVAATLGMKILHAPVRDGAAKGKIERFFQTVRTQFLDTFNIAGAPATIIELNNLYASWREKYNNSFHSGIGCTPAEKWHATAHKLVFKPDDVIHAAFMVNTTRLTKKDGTFSLHGIRYETDAHLAGKKINVKYNPFFPDRIMVSYEKVDYGQAHPLDPHFNSQKKRKKL